jgi:CDP-2,3-bis-(O-geranylgeranyl)-sn-glycerol synthase
MQWLIIFKLMVLLTVANGTPVIATKLFGKYFNQPLDRGVTFVDGRPVFGSAKTIRGIILSLVVATITAPALSFAWTYGLIVASVAMSGDLLSSFLKRRLGLPPSSRAIGIDQIPECLATDYSDPFDPWSGRLRCCCFGSDHFLLRASPSFPIVLQIEYPKSPILTNSYTQAMESNFRGAIEPHRNDG